MELSSRSRTQLQVEDLVDLDVEDLVELVELVDLVDLYTLPQREEEIP